MRFSICLGLCSPGRKNLNWSCGSEPRIEAFVGPEAGLPVLAFDELTARESGWFRTMSEEIGKRAAPSDMKIGGVSSAMAASLATRNVPDFEGLGLNLINPRAD